MGARRIRRDQRQFDMRKSRVTNGVLKAKERVRRTDRMLELIKKQGSAPYTPVIMSWLSQELDKPSRLISQAEVNELVNRPRA